MYFPFIRGKTYDLLALRELLNDIRNPSDFYLPIIEPVKNDISNLKKLFDECSKKGQKFILIVNPLVGELKESDISVIKKFFLNNNFDFGKIIFAYQIRSNTKSIELTNFQNLFSNESKNNKFVFIHTEANLNLDNIKNIIRGGNVLYNILDEEYTDRMYRNEIKKLKTAAVVIRDNFKILKNANYPADDFFSDLYAVHKDEGYEGGFGDYLTIGKEYRDTGGAAYAVAIHLTYFSNRNVLHVRHFKSKTNDSPVNVAGKFLEALNDMFAYIKTNDASFQTKACEEFRQLYKTKIYKGLGYIKKLSIKHHIELIVNKIKSENAK
jgi:hypothetical protein